MATRDQSSAIYLGDQLDVDLWFKGNVSEKQSVLIRTTTPDGVVKSSFMHLDGEVRQIPTFQSSDPLVLEEKVRNVKGAQKISRKSPLSKALSISFVLILLTVFASLVTGLFQARVVLTGSMVPTIKPGDVVVAESTRFVTPKVGDVVLYSARDLQGKAVTVWAHRIIDGNMRDGFTIKGDANTQPDIGTIPLSDIQSVVTFTIPKAGKLLNPFSLISVIGGLFALTFVIRLVRQDK